MSINPHDIERVLDHTLEHFRAIVQSSDDAIISKTLDGLVTSWNAGAQAIFGYSEQEMLGKPMLAIFPPDRVDEETYILQQVGNGIKVDHFETVRVHKNGKPINVSVTISPIRDRNGVIIGASKIARDITQRVKLEDEAARAESQVREMAQRLALATDAALIGTWDWDASKADQWYASPTYFTMLGYDPEEGFALREQWTERLHPDDRQAVADRIAAVLAGADLPYQYEARLRHADGNYRWVVVTGRVLARDGSGRPTRIMGVRVDITERKLAEDALRESESRYRELFYSNPQPMWVFDIQTQAFLAVNAATVAHYGYSREELMAMTIRDIRPEEEQARLTEMRQRPSNGLRASGVWTHLRKGGQRILVEITSHPLIYDGRKAMLVLANDVTDVKRSQQALEALNQELEARVETRSAELKKAMTQLMQVEKLAALGNLVAGIAHELNTPIGVVLTAASALKDEVVNFGNQLLSGKIGRAEVERKSDQIREASLLIERNAFRSAKLVADFKQVAVDQSSARRRQFLLHDVVVETMELMAPTYTQRDHQIHVDIDPAFSMDSFPGPLQQILTNLLTNTLYHAYDNQTKGSIHIQAEADGAYFVLRYSDEGRGMPEDVLKHVFEPFFTTRLGQGGSGLGLYIVHNLVTGILGGSVAIHSELNKGTTITLRLPAKVGENRA